jgi:hypothetical protein
MAKTENGQLAQCVDKKEFPGNNGEVVVSYKFLLDGETKTFPVMATKELTPQVGKYYSPVLYLAQKAKNAKTGEAYISNYCAVKWREV